MYLYVGNRPLFAIDPEGTVYVKNPINPNPVAPDKLSPATACGDKPAKTWDFWLDAWAPCDGYIVQKIDLWCIKRACGTNGCDCPSILELLLTAPSTYWEAWKVNEQHDRSLVAMEYGFTDTAQGNCLEGTCGMMFQFGEIRFYCAGKWDAIKYSGTESAATGDLGDDAKKGTAKGWEVEPQYYGPCLGSAGTLPSMGLPGPKFWNWNPRGVTSERIAGRWFYSSWCCCGNATTPGRSCNASAGTITPFHPAPHRPRIGPRLTPFGSGAVE
jgi:hypothetical protein